MEKVKFTSKNRNIKRNKSMKAVPSVVYKRKSTNKVILKYLDFLYMDKEVKRVFTLITHDSVPKCSKSKQLFHFFTYKHFALPKELRGFYECGGKCCEVCINVNPTSPFTCTLIGGTKLYNKSDLILMKISGQLFDLQ